MRGDLTAADAEGEEAECGYFVVEGVLSELSVELGTTNLMAKVDRRYRRKAALTGAAASAAELFGSVASSAALAMYDGEDTQNFIGLLNGQVICGQFGGAERLTEGRVVRAVVERFEDVLVAKAILDPTAGLLWIRWACGTQAEAAANWRMTYWILGLGVLLAAVFAIREGFAFFLLSSLAWIALIAPFGFSNALASLSDPSTRSFDLLGFNDPGKVDLSSHKLSLTTFKAYRHAEKVKPDLPMPKFLFLAEFETRDIYDLSQALADGKVSFRDPSFAASIQSQRDIQ